MSTLAERLAAAFDVLWSDGLNKNKVIKPGRRDCSKRIWRVFEDTGEVLCLRIDSKGEKAREPQAQLRVISSVNGTTASPDLLISFPPTHQSCHLLNPFPRPPITARAVV